MQLPAQPMKEKMCKINKVAQISKQTNDSCSIWFENKAKDSESK